MFSRAARGCFSLRKSKDQTEADIYVSFFLILRVKQGNLDISLPSLAPASFPAFSFLGVPHPPASPSQCLPEYSPTTGPSVHTSTILSCEEVQLPHGWLSCNRQIIYWDSFRTWHWQRDICWVDGRQKKKRGLFTAGALVLLATRPLPCPRPPLSFPFFLPAPCCQLPKDICSHPLLNEKVLMHDFRICQNIQYLQVFGDAANLTTGKRNE